MCSECLECEHTRSHLLRLRCRQQERGFFHGAVRDYDRLLCRSKISLGIENGNIIAHHRADLRVTYTLGLCDTISHALGKAHNRSLLNSRLEHERFCFRQSRFGILQNSIGRVQGVQVRNLIEGQVTHRERQTR